MENELLRHVLATIQHRFQIAVDGKDDAFGFFRSGHGIRTPNELLDHINYLLVPKSINIIKNASDEQQDPPEGLQDKIEVFEKKLISIDKLLAMRKIDVHKQKTLLQGPFSDILTHIGQLLLLRRSYGDPTQGGNYSSVDIRSGISENDEGSDQY